MKISIPQPCHENWHEMTPNERGRFCASCQKTVVDFTDWTDKMLIDFLLKNKTVTCGRFTNIQLEKEFTSRQPRKRLYYIAAAFSLISLFTQAPLAHAQTTQVRSEQTANPTHGKYGGSKVIYTVKGSILDIKSKEPIVNVVIQFYKENDALPVAGCITDMDGNYEMKGIEPGKYRVIVRLAGYKTTSKIIEIDSGNPTVIANFRMGFDNRSLGVVTITRGGKFLITDSSANLHVIDSSKKH